MICFTSADILNMFNTWDFVCVFFSHKVEIWKILIVGVKLLSEATNSHSVNKGITMCKQCSYFFVTGFDYAKMKKLHKKDFTIGLSWYHVAFWLHLTSLRNITHFAVQCTVCIQRFVDYIDLEIKEIKATTLRCSVKKMF